ncbi:Bacteriophage head to tail connecting protein [compost metagenome]
MSRPTAATLWTKYRDSSVIEKCREYSRYTLPGLYVDPMITQQTVEHDFQSVGGFLLNHLGSKVTRALFPPGVPFFKNVLSEELKAAAEQRGNSVAELENILNKVDNQATEKLFLNAATSQLTNAIKLLAMTGNILLYRDKDTAAIRVWTLHSYAVRRISTGVWRTVILKEKFQLDELPPSIRNDYLAKKPGQKDQMHSQIDMYTRLEREVGSVNDRIVVTTEIDGVRCGPVSSYPAHLCPWVVATWNLSSGEHYGRGMVEDYTGDFAKLSLMSEQLGLYELESLSLLNLVDEAAGGVIDEYQEADTGDFVRGKTAGITSYERGDYNKIAAISGELQQIVQRLSMAFLYSGNTRDAERVTAAEVRLTAAEAEQMLGGVYSLLAEQLQLPLAYLVTAEVSDTLMAGLVTRAYKPQILTGIPALTRAIMVQNLLEFSQEAAIVVPAVLQMDDRVDRYKLLDVLYSAKNIDTSTIFKSPTQMAEDAKLKEQAAAQAQADTNVLGAAPDIQATISQLG